MPLQQGTRVGPYEVVARIGAGGMGEVWLATELRLGRKVALKLLPPNLTSDAARILRFEQEARAASALNHPNVCTIYALDQTSEGQHYIAMEYVEGETLRGRLTTARVSVREALDIAIQVAAALSVAHTAGIVHRDIKPENVMLRPDGVVKVLDFGLAKLGPVGSQDAETTRLGVNTDAGTVVGTAAYMSPEQARGQQVDARTDIWSLGVMLYEMVAGRSPFAGPSGTDVLAAILQNEPAPVARFDPDAPAEVQRILTKTLRKDRSQRYQTVQDLLLDLQALRDDLQAQSRSGSGPVAQAADQGSGPSATAAAVSPRSRLPLRLAIIMLLGLAAAGAWWWSTADRVQPSTSAPAAPVQRDVTRLTFETGLQTNVTFSPDARFIAYASDRAGNFDIWVQPVAGGDAVQITKSPAQETEPAWSPDGSTIAFRSDRNEGGVFLVPALGGQERRLAAAGMFPRWSPDGSQILLQSARWEDRVRVEFSLVRPGEAARPVLADFMRDGEFWWAAWHPDGRLSIVGRHRTLGLGFFTAPVEDGTPVKSARAAALTDRLAGIAEFSWTPDGRHVIVAANPAVGIINVWRVAVEGDALTWASAERLTTGATMDTRVAISPDGRTLAYTVAEHSYALHAFDIPPPGQLVREGSPVTPPDEWVGTSDVSRDGRKLAYVTFRRGDRTWLRQLWTTDLGSGHREPVSADRAERRAPAWSPDGMTLAYHHVRSLSDPASSLAVRDRSGRERFLSATRENGLVIPWQWTADARYVVASARRLPGPTSLGLWSVDRSGEAEPERVLISEPSTNFWQGRFSPNGRWLSFVYVKDGENATAVAIAPAGGGEPGTWIRLPGDMAADKPRWSADGRSLYFIGRRAKSLLHLWRIGFDPIAGGFVGEPQQLTNFSRPDREINPEVGESEIAVTASNVFLTLRGTSGSIWMLDNVDK